MEISNLLTSSYYDAERVLQNKIDIARSTNTERTEKGVEGRGEFISQDTYDKLSGLRFQMGGYEMQRITVYSEEMGEYDGYLPNLCELLKKGGSEEQIFNFLWTAETDSMGLSGDEQATREFSKWLISLNK